MKPSAETRSVGKRWTAELVHEGWTPVADVFLKNYAELKITTAEAMLIIHLLQFKWDQKHPYPAVDTLAKRMGMSSTAVRNHIRSLEGKKLLNRIPVMGKANRFDLEPLFVALARFLRPVEGK